MDVSTIMTSRPVTVQPHALLAEAMQVMDDHDIRHLPVLEGDDLVGIVSDRDLLSAIGWAAGPSRPALASNGAPRTVADIMHTNLSVVAPEDTVVTVAVELELHSIGCLPVVQNDCLLGIVTEMDLAGAYWRACRESKLDGDVDPQVIEHMTSGVRTVGPEMSIVDATAIAKELGVRHLPVVEGDAVVGMLSDRDLRAAAGSGRAETGTVAEIMASAPITICPFDQLSLATELMVDHRISALPVVHEERLVGILTLADILGHCMNTLREPESQPD